MPAQEDAAACDHTLALVWLRRDLRLADHAPFAAAVASGYMLPAFCLDPAELGPRQWASSEAFELATGVPQLGPHRLRLLLEALQGLDASLREQGSGLAFRLGAPHVQLPLLLHQAAAGNLAPPAGGPAPASPPSSQQQAGALQHVQLLYHQLPLPEAAAAEQRVAAAVTAAARQLGVSCSVRPFWGATLYHPDDLPYAAFAAASGQGAGGGGGKQGQQQGRARDGGHGGGEATDVSPARLACLGSLAMTSFRKLTQQQAGVRAALPAPANLPPLPSPAGGGGGGADSGAPLLGAMPGDPIALYDQAGAGPALARLQELTGAGSGGGGAGRSADPRCAFPFVPSEQAALRRLRHYLWGQAEGAAGGGPAASPPALTYFADSRMQAVGVDNSTKLSPFLALGCISPRQVYEEVQQLLAASAAGGGGAGSGGAPGGAAGLADAAEAHWLVMHLCIRDYFIFTALRAGPALYRAGGVGGGAAPGEPWRADPGDLAAWAAGATGLPFVDAAMRELAASGWSSNRSRQNASSLLAKSLRLDWRAGAELFECLLLDCEPAVNWANWQYFAGVGTDPRNRVFKTVTQGEQYDADARLALAWLPELAGLPAALRHRPWAATPEQAAAAGYAPGAAYPDPIVDVATQIGEGPKRGKDKQAQAGRQRRAQAAAA